MRPCTLVSVEDEEAAEGEGDADEDADESKASKQEPAHAVGNGVAVGLTRMVTVEE